MRFVFFFQAEDGIRDLTVTGVQTCALPICALTDTSADIEIVRHRPMGFAEFVIVIAAIMALNPLEIGRASLQGKSVDLGGRRIIKKKTKKKTSEGRVRKKAVCSGLTVKWSV